MVDFSQPYMPNALSNMQALKVGQSYMDQNALRNDLKAAGQVAAGGDLQGAQNQLLSGGHIDEAEKLRGMANGMEDRKLALVKTAYAKMGDLARLATTPQQWAAALQAAKSHGLDTAGYEDFNTGRQMALAQSGKVGDVIEEELKRRELSIRQQALAHTQAAAKVWTALPARTDAYGNPQPQQTMNVHTGEVRTVGGQEDGGTDDTPQQTGITQVAGQAAQPAAPQGMRYGPASPKAPEGYVHKRDANGFLWQGRAPVWEPKAEPVDKKYADDYLAFRTEGAPAVQKNITQLGEAKRRLDEEQNISGPVVGSIPDWMAAYINPNAVSTRELVEEVAQGNLRQVLGGQFAMKEGEQLILRAYNPKLDQQENAGRVQRLMQQIQAAYDAKLAMAQYYEQKGTLRGYSGPEMPTLDAVSAAIEGRPSKKMAQAAPAPAAPAPGSSSAPVKVRSKSEFNALPKGTLFEAPDGSVRRKP